MSTRVTSQIEKWVKFYSLWNGNSIVPNLSKWRTGSCSRFYSVQADPAKEESITAKFQAGTTTYLLNDGVDTPTFGLGVWKLHSVETVLFALEKGYRLVDTASRYGNEAEVGEALRLSGIPPKEVFIVTKLYDTEHGYDESLRACEQSLRRLGLDYVDQYLIHSPVGGKIMETWRGLEKLQQDKMVRSIGVSNFGIHHLEELCQRSEVIPAVNQIELHPFLQERDIVTYCRDRGIYLQAYRSLVCGSKLSHPVIVSVARKYGKTPAQVLIRWCIEKGYCCIPKTEKKERIVENMDVFDFSLDDEDLGMLDSLEEGLRSCHYKIKEPWTG